LNFPLGLNDKESISINGIKFHGIPAAHNELERDENGRCRFMGYVIEIGGKKIYHSGDTLLYPGMENILRPFEVDLAILPINGNDPSRGVAGNLSVSEAVWLSQQIGARLTIPCHYDLFSFNTVDVSLFIDEAKKMSIPFKVLEPGEGMTL
jgi:L-ascorbate metabolism protein UlaG (beta-lactamase superfamily)